MADYKIKRLMLLCQLADGELSVREIQSRVGLSQSALSQHLALLREEGIVATRRESQTIYYRIVDHAAMSVVIDGRGKSAGRAEPIVTPAAIATRRGVSLGRAATGSDIRNSKGFRR